MIMSNIFINHFVLFTLSTQNGIEILWGFIPGHCNHYLKEIFYTSITDYW